MGDYNLAGLSSRSFEQMIQALSLKIIGPGVVIFGDGPDGGREAIYQGRLAGFPSQGDCWDGYLVVQAKFCQRPKGDPRVDAEWLIGQLKKELDDFADPKKKRKAPEFYIIATNVGLSPVQAKGGKDKVAELFESYRHKIAIRGFLTWDYDQICRYLDGDESIRHAYTAWLTSGDVLGKMADTLEFHRPNFAAVMTNFLQKELLENQFSKLEQAGHSPENRIPLEKVFIDLPSFHEQRAQPPEEKQPLPPGFLSHMLEVGALRIGESQSQTNLLIIDLGKNLEKPEPGRYVLVGGPGQGKSTLGQFLCQIQRAALLKERKGLDRDTKRAIQSITKQSEESHLSLTNARRFPIHIELARFAKSLATAKESKINSILTYVCALIRGRSNYDIEIGDIRLWLENYPWLVVLDGLDEVPSSSNRSEVMAAVRDFLIDVAACNADVLVLTTTRPQGYHEEFSPSRYQHNWLAPLSIPRALYYGKCLVECTYQNNVQRRNEVQKRLEKAAEVAATARLMESPLQVTIMARLLAQIAQPPQERYRLFQQYYEVIYRREMEREVEPLSRILRDHKTDIDSVHHRMGLLLQIESERTQHTDATMPVEEFETVLRERLRDEGHHDAQLINLTTSISSCTTDRLVFLVPSQSGRVGFEIRSLQEFMAAEAIMDAPDDIAVERLKRVATVPFWRNVFLFAAGRIFADRQWLRDNVSQICAELNDNPDDPLAHYTLAGSRLAYSLLEDGPARRQPIYAQTLARNALSLLTLPYETAARSLADVFEIQLQTVYEEEIIRNLANINVPERLSAWSLLISLLYHSVSWAERIADKYWPTDADEQTQILEQWIDAEGNRWIDQKISAVLFKMPIQNIMYNRMHREHDFSVLARSAHDFFDQRRRSTDDQFTDPSKLVVARITPVSGKCRESFLVFRDLIDVHPTLRPFVECAHFAENPSHIALSKTIRSLARNYSEPVYGTSLLPWPIAACLEASSSPADLEALAAIAERGEMGRLEDWMDAEKRWQVSGIVPDDFTHMADDNWPIPSDIAKVGFPFAAADLNIDFPHRGQEVAEGIWNKWQAELEGVWNRLPGTRMRSVFSSALLDYAGMEPLSVQKEQSWKNIVIEVIMHTVTPRLQYISLGLLSSLLQGNWHNNEVKETLDLIGRNFKAIYERRFYVAQRYYGPRSSDRMISIQDMFTILASLFLSDQRQVGILRIASKLTTMERVPVASIFPFEPGEDPELLAPYIILRIAEPAIDKSRAMDLARQVLSASNTVSRNYPTFVLDALSCFENHQMDNPWASAFLEEVIKGLPEGARSAKEQVVRLMLDSISRRTSQLHELDVWSKLKLPSGLHSLLST